ncbi:MAG: SixA phosphatase family protein [Chloroflexia bacterium]
MKTLLLLRHGKAERDAPGGDHERTLTERGTRNSEAMGKYLAAKIGCPDAVVSSDAKRAYQTAELAVSAGGCRAQVVANPKIYLADVDTLIDVVRNLPAEAASVMLVGHNPAFEGLANILTETGTPANSLPTAGLVQLEFDVQHWTDVLPGGGVLRGLHTPDDIAGEA